MSLTMRLTFSDNDLNISKKNLLGRVSIARRRYTIKL